MVRPAQTSCPGRNAARSNPTECRNCNHWHSCQSVVANTRTGFSSRPGGTATNISRAPTSIRAAFRLQHRPVFQTHSFVSSPPLGFRFRRLQIIALFLVTGCSQAAQSKVLFQSESVGLRQLLTTALRTELGATLLFGVRKPSTDTTAYFHCLSLHLRMQKWGGQDKFLSALPRPPAGPYAVEKLLSPKFTKVKLR
jgi:hypothetical protein